LTTSSRTFGKVRLSMIWPLRVTVSEGIRGNSLCHLHSCDVVRSL
jgi:hypothetical protein